MAQTDVHEIRYPVISYLVLFILCIASIHLFVCGITKDPNMELVYIVYIGKIIKTISYLFIFYSILDWVMSVDGRHSDNTFRHATLAKLCLTITLSVVTILTFQIIGFAVSGEKHFSMGPFWDVVISMLPIAVLCYSNYKIMHEDQEENTKESAKMFYLYLYVPILTATATIIVMWRIADSFLHYEAEGLYVMVSGSMAFLVFVAHAIDKMIHENAIHKEYNLLTRCERVRRVCSVFCPDIIKNKSVTTRPPPKKSKYNNM